MTTTLAAGERAVSDRLLGRAQEIGQVEMSRLLARTPRSAQLFDRATRMASMVASVPELAKRSASRL
jgi:hypothetical protein